jgi:hypothetical protein
MKKNLPLFLLIFALFYSCSSEKNNSQSSEEEKKWFGLKEITPNDAVNVDDALTKLDNKENLEVINIGEGVTAKGLKLKVRGEVVDICKSSGCWFTFQTKSGKELFIQMKEHKKTEKGKWIGKTVVVEGELYSNEISVQELRQNAKSEGASREEISKIKEAKTEYILNADGAILAK